MAEIYFFIFYLWVFNYIHEKNDEKKVYNTKPGRDVFYCVANPWPKISFFRQSCAKYSGTKVEKSPPPTNNAESSFELSVGGLQGAATSTSIVNGGRGHKMGRN